jgi:hypothetical protein
LLGATPHKQSVSRPCQHNTDKPNRRADLSASNGYRTLFMSRREQPDKEGYEPTTEKPRKPRIDVQLQVIVGIPRYRPRRLEQQRKCEEYCESEEWCLHDHKERKLVNYGAN